MMQNTENVPLEGSFTSHLENEFFVFRIPIGQIEEFQVKMLQQNDLTCLLKMHYMNHDGHGSLYYRITDHLNLPEYIRQFGASYALMKSLMTELSEVFAALHDYLLYENGLLLEEDNIYIDIRTGKCKFIYLPQKIRSRDNLRQLQKLIQWLIPNIHKQDEKAITFILRIRMLLEDQKSYINALKSGLEYDDLKEIQIEHEVGGFEVGGTYEEIIASKTELTESGNEKMLGNRTGKNKGSGKESYKESIKENGKENSKEMSRYHHEETDGNKGMHKKRFNKDAVMTFVVLQIFMGVILLLCTRQWIGGEEQHANRLLKIIILIGMVGISQVVMFFKVLIYKEKNKGEDCKQEEQKEKKEQKEHKKKNQKEQNKQKDQEERKKQKEQNKQKKQIKQKRHGTNEEQNEQKKLIKNVRWFKDKREIGKEDKERLQRVKWQWDQSVEKSGAHSNEEVQIKEILINESLIKENLLNKSPLYTYEFSLNQEKEIEVSKSQIDAVIQETQETIETQKTQNTQNTQEEEIGAETSCSGISISISEVKDPEVNDTSIIVPVLKETVSKDVESKAIESKATESKDTKIKRAYLVNAQGIHIPLLKTPFIIGKLKSVVDYSIQNELVSRIHCQILIEGERYYLIDLGSRNGTYLNQNRIEAHMKNLLQDKDEIGIIYERYLFKFI